MSKPDKVLDTFVFQKDFAEHYSITHAKGTTEFIEARGERPVNEKHSNIVIIQGKKGLDWSTGIQFRICPPTFVKKRTRDIVGGEEWA